MKPPACIEPNAPAGGPTARAPDTAATVSRRRFSTTALSLAGLVPAFHVGAAPARKRVFIVDSYHRSYLWSESTQSGATAAMRKLGYLDNDDQARALARNDQVESSRAVIRKDWMDTKRRDSRAEMAAATGRIMAAIRAFRPDLVMLGDDNAARFIGGQLLDSNVPAVFWGINGLPLKYGLVDNLDTPGRNITGVWQQGYHKESLDLLKRLVPKAQTFAILACDSESSRPNVKMIEQLAQRGVLPLKLVDRILTNSLDEFKERALEASRKVDAFFVLNHDTLRDARGNHVDMLDVGRWYLQNIRIPEASHEDQFVLEGMLLTANDSGFNQGFLAFEMAHGILERGLNPARMAVRTPERGPYLVNRHRARQLGIELDDAMYLIDEVIDKSIALGIR
ncbi:MAG: ABC transporter substrate-binding protein [Rubrivivax sp.]